MINIVIPMAGLGSRFRDVGYQLPKPFIDVLKKPMISHVMENLAVPNCRFILVAQEKHVPHFEVCGENFWDQYRAEVVTVDGLTQGSACTVLAAHRLINNGEPLVIANSDQFIEGGITDFVADAARRDLDGSILTFIDKHRDPKWSFVETTDQGLVTKCAEKIAISDRATVGVYYFKQGKLFVDAALDMIVRQDTNRNEYYTCPTYNYLVKQKLRTGFFDISFSDMHGLGTPDDLNAYIRYRSQ